VFKAIFTDGLLFFLSSLTLLLEVLAQVE